MSSSSTASAISSTRTPAASTSCSAISKQSLSAAEVSVEPSAVGATDTLAGVLDAVAVLVEDAEGELDLLVLARPSAQYLVLVVAVPSVGAAVTAGVVVGTLLVRILLWDRARTQAQPALRRVTHRR